MGRVSHTIVKQFDEKLSDIRDTYSGVFAHDTVLVSVDSDETIDLSQSFQENVQQDVHQLYNLAHQAVRLTDIEGEDAQHMLDDLHAVDPLLSVANLSLDNVSHHHHIIHEYLYEAAQS